MKNKETKKLFEKLALGKIAFNEQTDVLYCNEKPSDLIFNLPPELKIGHEAFVEEFIYNENQPNYEIHHCKLITRLKEILFDLKDFYEEIDDYLVPEKGDVVYYWYTVQNENTGEIEYYPDSKNVFLPNHPSNSDIIFIRTIIERQIEWTERTFQVLTSSRFTKEQYFLPVQSPIKFNLNSEKGVVCINSTQATELRNQDRLLWNGSQIELIHELHNLVMTEKIKVDSRQSFEICLEKMFDFTHGGKRKPVKNVQNDLSEILRPYNGNTVFTKRQANLKRKKYLKREIEAFKKAIQERENMISEIEADKFVKVEGWVRDRISKYP